MWDKMCRNLRRLPLSFQHRPLCEGPAEMYRLTDSLQDGSQGGDGLFNQEDEADVCRAPELVRKFLFLTSASGHGGCTVVNSWKHVWACLKWDVTKHPAGRFHCGSDPGGTKNPLRNSECRSCMTDQGSRHDRYWLSRQRDNLHGFVHWSVAPLSVTGCCYEWDSDRRLWRTTTAPGKWFVFDLF